MFGQVIEILWMTTIGVCSMSESVCRYCGINVRENDATAEGGPIAHAACVEAQLSPTAKSGMRRAMASFGTHLAIGRGHVGGR